MARSNLKKFWLPALLFVCGAVAIGRGVIAKMGPAVPHYVEPVTWSQMVVAGGAMVVLAVAIAAARAKER